MIELIAVSLIWAFSFGLIKGVLAGVDPFWVAFLRLAFAAALFAPFSRWRGLDRREALALGGIGAVQYGLMYAAYTASFLHLAAWEVAVLTITTPLFVVAFEAASVGRLRPAFAAAAVLATLGAGIALRENLERSAFTAVGVLLVQASNVCFAAGQIAYRRWMRGRATRADAQVQGPVFLGAACTAGLLALAMGDPASLSMTPVQWGVAAYLGLVASGIGFFLFNRGARRVDAGTLAVFNDLKIPLATAVSLVVFGESARVGDLLLGGGLVLATLVGGMTGRPFEGRMSDDASADAPRRQP